MRRIGSATPFNPGCRALPLASPYAAISRCRGRSGFQRLPGGLGDALGIIAGGSPATRAQPGRPTRRWVSTPPIEIGTGTNMHLVSCRQRAGRRAVCQQHSTECLTSQTADYCQRLCDPAAGLAIRGGGANLTLPSWSVATCALCRPRWRRLRHVVLAWPLRRRRAALRACLILQPQLSPRQYCGAVRPSG
jgi:hypothetical protein